MTDTLTIVRGDTSKRTMADSTRMRMGLAPRNEHLEKFLLDQEAHAHDIKRSMIGCAVTQYRPYADLYE